MVSTGVFSLLQKARPAGTAGLADDGLSLFDLGFF